MIWTVQTRNIFKRVEAESATEAFEALRDCNPYDFGLVVVARPEGSGDPLDDIPIRTSKLFGRWGNEIVARMFIARAIEIGLEDTSETDLPSRKKKAN